MRKSKVYTTTDSQFTALVLSSNSMSDLLRKIGLSTNGGNSNKVAKERIHTLGISTDHFTIKIAKTTDSTRYTLEEACVANSTYQNRTKLKERLIKEKWLIYHCYICRLVDWNNQPIALHLDHINGINNDHRLENLRLLCPNCHSQTETYAGKNKIRQ